MFLVDCVGFVYCFGCGVVCFVGVGVVGMCGLINEKGCL